MSKPAKSPAKNNTKKSEPKTEKPQDPSLPSTTNAENIEISLGMTRLLRVQAIPRISLRILKAEATWAGNASYRLAVEVEAKHILLREGKLPEGNLKLTTVTPSETPNKPNKSNVGIPVHFNRSAGTNVYSLVTSSDQSIILHCLDFDLIGTGKVELDLSIPSIPFAPIARFDNLSFDGSPRFDHPVGDIPTIERSQKEIDTKTVWLGTPAIWDPTLSVRFAGCILWLGWSQGNNQSWSIPWVILPSPSDPSRVLSHPEHIQMGIAYDPNGSGRQDIALVFPNGAATTATFFCKISRTANSPKITLWESNRFVVPKPRPNTSISVEPDDRTPGTVIVKLGTNFDIINQSLAVHLFTDVAILYPNGGTLASGQLSPLITSAGKFGTLDPKRSPGAWDGSMSVFVPSPEDATRPLADLSKVSFQGIFRVLSRTIPGSSDQAPFAAAQYLDISSSKTISVKPVSDLLKKPAEASAKPPKDPSPSNPQAKPPVLAGLTNASWYFGTEIVKAMKATLPTPNPAPTPKSSPTPKQPPKKPKP